MIGLSLLLMNFALVLPAEAVDPACTAAVQEVEAPVEFETRGKPRRARWEQVDKVIYALGERLSGETDCRLKFDQIFVSEGDDEIYFPVTHVLLKYADEESLKGLKIYTQEGEVLGQFVTRFPYERTGGTFSGRSYTLYYFQYRTPDGEIQAVSRRQLLDNFLVRWSELKARQAFPGSGETGGNS